MNSIMRKKPISAFEADMKKNELNRVLKKWGLTSLGIGAIIGGGIFTLTGIAAHDYAGPALAIAFIIAGIGCTFASLCYAEFASVLPVEGSAYSYAYGTVGEFFAWFIGWLWRITFLRRYRKHRDNVYTFCCPAIISRLVYKTFLTRLVLLLLLMLYTERNC